MLLDITLKLTPKEADEAWNHTDRSLVGHLGTHFDVMEQVFPLEYTRREGIVWDVSAVRGRDIDIADIDECALQRGQFVAFYTGYLITRLLDAGVSIIGIDCAGVRRGAEHTLTDRRCAACGTFVVENLCGLKAVLDCGGRFTAHTYPLNYSGVTGLPCRVLAEV